MTQTAPPNNPYQPMLTESIQRFLTEYRNGVTDFSNFGSIFSRLLQIVPDPPLQILWFYSALTFHTSKLTHHHHNSPISKRVVLVKELFQLLTARSSPCGQFKKIATLAPVIYELYHLAVQHDNKISRKEIENLLEGVVSYTSICCGGGGSCEVVGVKEEEESLTVSGFRDVLGVWTVDNCGDRDELRVFFPVVSEEVRNGIRVGCGVGYLAGVVMCEAFLLRLCLKFGSGNSRLELEKDLHNWAIQTINGFQSFWFLDTLLKMLLEPVLPVTSLLSYEDEILLQEVLYDVVIRVEYSFLEPSRVIQLAGKHLKNLILKWLFVADTTIRSAREKGNQAKAFSYINAFSESCLPSQLIKWVTDQTVTGRKISKPNVSTPVALLGWLLTVEEQEVRVFDCEISKVQAKAAICKSRVEYVLPELKPNGNSLNESSLFSLAEEVRGEDKFNGDLEMVDSVDTAFLVANGMMKTTATDGTRKRKEGIKDEKELQVKFVKHHFHETSVREKCFLIGNDDGLSSGLSSGSEVDNPVSDEDMEDIRQ
ncbi:hypothetical protein CMV_000906 [Castanea mollissima]|uniref:Uncharacterized protein n=1 Tax=Castanea mollissima TaxID=60419 RepID=A0A8J4W705_9ROSI|nr:hypothetical protein CMV_000906 [Castanea mollissima]